MWAPWCCKMKRQQRSRSPILVKKQKTEKIVKKNYSSLLTQPFSYDGSMFVAYVYQFTLSPSFGLLLPVVYPNNTVLKYLYKTQVSYDGIHLFETFQNKFWHDLKKSAIESSNLIKSEANYFVVPLDCDCISSEIIKACLENTTKKCSDVPDSERQNHIWVKINNNSSTVKYIKTVPNTVTEFFTLLLGKDHPNLNFYCKKFAAKNVLDIIQKEELEIQSLKTFKYKDTPIKLENLAFIKNTRSIVYDPKLYSKETIFISGTPLINTEELATFYLNKYQYNQIFALVESLIKVEQLSRSIEFSQILGYKGDIDWLHKAMTSSSADYKSNYEALETIGDCILKYVVSLSNFIKSREKSEKEYTKIRSLVVSNNHLADVAKKLNFSFFITTEIPSHAKFVPAYFYSPKNILSTNHLVTDGVLADFIEAIIGCFYIGENLQRAGKFLQNIQIIDNYSQIKKFLTKEKLSIFCEGKSWRFNEEIFRVFQSSQGKVFRNRIEIGKFCYEYKDQQMIRTALTHYSVNEIKNYEKFEFLGDAVLDLAVLTSIFHYKDFDPSSLSALKQLLVCNQHLSCISLFSGLYKYLDSNTLPFIESTSISELIKNDLFSLNSCKLNLNKQLGDIIESLIGSILIDSRSLKKTFSFISELFSASLSYALAYHIIYLNSHSTYFKFQVQNESVIKFLKKI